MRDESAAHHPIPLYFFPLGDVALRRGVDNRDRFRYRDTPMVFWVAATQKAPIEHGLMGANRIICVVAVLVVAKESIPALILELFNHLADFILCFAQLLLKPS
jgi:hypothetical protein